MNPAIRAVRRDVLFGHYLDRVRDALQKPERSYAVRTETVLHARDDLALQPRQENECDGGEQHDDRDAKQLQRERHTPIGQKKFSTS